MTGPMDDEHLLGLVAASLAGDRPPPEAVEAAYAAHGWRTLEADLARLIDDAAPEVVGFQQGPVCTRVVTFETWYGLIEVAIDPDGFDVVARPTPRRLVVRRPHDETDLALPGIGGDARLGVTVRGPAVTGPIRIEATWPAGRAVTPWITL